jgi:hypothetical protein
MRQLFRFRNRIEYDVRTPDTASTASLSDVSREVLENIPLLSRVPLENAPDDWSSEALVAPVAAPMRLISNMPCIQSHEEAIDVDDYDESSTNVAINGRMYSHGKYETTEVIMQRMLTQHITKIDDAVDYVAYAQLINGGAPVSDVSLVKAREQFQKDREIGRYPMDDDSSDSSSMSIYYTG